MGVLITIGLGLLALFTTGLLFTLVVNLTTSVGRFIIKKLKERRHTIVSMRMRELLETVMREKQNETDTENANKMIKELGPEAIAIWEQDEDTSIREDSIVIVKSEQVDEKTRRMLDDNNGAFVISPTAL